MVDESFRILFDQLCNMPYEAHWWNRVPVDQVLQGVPSDCSDRTYVMADYCEKNNIKYSFILTLFKKPELSLHMAIVVDGLVYDPIWPVYGMPIVDYQKLLSGSYSHVFGSWIKNIIP
jgi:hypothetical protein